MGKDTSVGEKASSPKDVVVVPAEQRGVGMARVEGREPDRAAVERVVVAAVLELFADAPADFASIVRRHGDVAAIEEHVNAGAEQNAVRHEVHAADDVGLDVRGLQHRQRALAGERAAAIVRIRQFSLGRRDLDELAV